MDEVLVEGPAAQPARAIGAQADTLKESAREAAGQPRAAWARQLSPLLAATPRCPSEIEPRFSSKGSKFPASNSTGMCCVDESDLIASHTS